MSKLNIFNQQEKIIGQEERSTVHRDGLWHQEVNVWFYTPQGEIIFQHRAKNKDMWPDKLDATVGGHVELDKTYDETAITEIKEETGLDLNIKDLNFTGKIHRESMDAGSNKRNNTFKATYIHRYIGLLSDLTPEKGKAIGFEAWDLDSILNIGEEDKHRFIPSVFSPDVIKVFEKIRKKLAK